MLNYKVPWEQKVAKTTEKKILELCGINPNNDNSKLRLLDFGCGNGRYLEVFRKYLNEENLYGTEVLLDRVHEVRKKGFNCIHLSSGGNKLPFEDEFFDIVFSSNVIEHIPKKYYLGYLKEICRILKRGGRFVIGTPNYPVKRFYDILKAFKTGMFKYYLFDDPTHCNKLSIGRLENDLKINFDEVYLEPSYILFEDQIKLLKNYKMRNKLKYFGDKISGYCLKGGGEP